MENKKKVLTKTEQLLKRLCNQIIRNKFNDLNYRTQKSWWGLQLQTMPLFCSYGAIGYKIMVYESDIRYFMQYTHTHTIRYDWELEALLVDGEYWKEYFGIS